MRRVSKAARNFLALCCATILFSTVAAQEAQAPFPVTLIVNETTIAGRAVALDGQHKLLPWPMPDNTGYSYAGYFLSQWTVLWDQYNRQRLLYFYCCFDFDRATFELVPDGKWVNSTGYLRAMMQGFMERLYPYTGDPRTLEFLESLVDYELAALPRATRGRKCRIHRPIQARNATRVGATTAKISSSRMWWAKTATLICVCTK
jgi:hypothetical protein